MRQDAKWSAKSGQKIGTPPSTSTSAENGNPSSSPQFQHQLTSWHVYFISISLVALFWFLQYSLFLSLSVSISVSLSFLSLNHHETQNLKVLDDWVSYSVTTLIHSFTYQCPIPTTCVPIFSLLSPSLGSLPLFQTPLFLFPSPFLLLGWRFSNASLFS